MGTFVSEWTHCGTVKFKLNFLDKILVDFTASCNHMLLERKGGLIGGKRRRLPKTWYML